jgi:hypothetical protein
LHLAAPVGISSRSALLYVPAASCCEHNLLSAKQGSHFTIPYAAKDTAASYGQKDVRRPEAEDAAAAVAKCIEGHAQGVDDPVRSTLSWKLGDKQTMTS